MPPSLDKLFLGLKSVPFWVLFALSASCASMLLIRNRFGMDLNKFDADYGLWLICGTVTFGFLALSNAAAKAAQFLFQRRSARLRVQRFYSRQRFTRIYNPLVKTLFGVYVDSTASVNARYFKDRLQNACLILGNGKWNSRKLRKAWRALFDRRIMRSTGVIDFGGTFPFYEIMKVVRENRTIADAQIVSLVEGADQFRVERQLADYEVSADDMDLIHHIFLERDRLEKLLTT